MAHTHTTVLTAIFPGKPGLAVCLLNSWYGLSQISIILSLATTRHTLYMAKFQDYYIPFSRSFPRVFQDQGIFPDFSRLEVLSLKFKNFPGQCKVCVDLVFLSGCRMYTRRYMFVQLPCRNSISQLYGFHLFIPYCHT